MFGRLCAWAIAGAALATGLIVVDSTDHSGWALLGAMVLGVPLGGYAGFLIGGFLWVLRRSDATPDKSD